MIMMVKNLTFMKMKRMFIKKLKNYFYNLFNNNILLLKKYNFKNE